MNKFPLFPGVTFDQLLSGLKLSKFYSAPSLVSVPPYFRKLIVSPSWRIISRTMGVKEVTKRRENVEMCIHKMV